MLDFRAVVANLRSLYQSLPPFERVEASMTARKAYFSVDTELAVQSFLYLFDHLFAHEQGRDALVMTAYAMPHLIRNDPRVRPAIERALKLGEEAKDPLTEQAYNYLGLIHAISDDQYQFAANLPSRARYWLSAARLARAATAMEFGTGCGSNAIQCARLEPAVEWYGVDLSEPQTASNQAQADRLGVKNVHFYTMAEAEKMDLKADCVASLDVLEHTVYPKEMIEMIEARVASNGIVCICTPNGAWSPWSDNIKGTVIGSHVGVESIPTLVAKVEPRGRVLDVRLIPGSAEEGNSNAGVTYQPYGQNKGAVFFAK